MGDEIDVHVTMINICVWSAPWEQDKKTGALYHVENGTFGDNYNTSNVYLVKDGTLFLFYGRKDFEKMTIHISV